MSDQALEKIANLEDEKQILDEIGGLIAREREALRVGGPAFAPAATGRKFPLLLNFGALVALGLVALGLVGWFTAAQASYVLQAAAQGTGGADIISALLAEAQGSLEAKNKEIAAIEAELADIDRQLADKGLTDLVKRKALTDRKSVLAGNLSKAVAERDALTRQVRYQTQNLEQAKAAAPAQGQDLLQSLMNQQELKKIYDQNLQAAHRSVGLAIQNRQWDQALAEAQRARSMAVEYAQKGPEGDRMSAQAEGQLLAGVEALATAAKTGWPDQAPVAAAPAPAPVALAPTTSAEDAKRIQDLSNQLAQASQRVQALEQVSKESSVQLETIMRTINTSLGGTGIGSPSASVTVDSLPVRIRALQQVADKVQEFQVTVKKLTSENEVLKASGQSGSAQLGTALTSFDQLYNTFSPGAPSTSTVATLPQRIQDLQKLILQGKDSQGLLQQQSSQLAAVNAKLTAVQADHDKLMAQLAPYDQLAKDYRTRTRSLSQAAAGADREALRKNLQTLLSVFKDNPAGAQLFPDYPIYLTTLVENLVDAETARVKALAQDELLAFMSTTSSKLADEQVRLLAKSGNSNKDATALLTSLIKEIDQVTDSTVKDRSGKVLPRALGTVINVAKPDVTVRKASRFETTKVKRVYLSRVLSSGDRIPIAEAEIVATSGEDVILRVISTIAPTIYPERNDLVYVEM